MTPEEIGLLSELTIIVPTYNRPLELERSIEYWRDTPVTVHILDGSDKPWFTVGLLSKIKNISYHHIPSTLGESWLDNYVRRLKFGADHSKTKYSAFCGGDDFFSMSGLSALVRLLESDSGIDAAVGQTLGFYPHESVVKWWLRYGAASVDNLFSRDPNALVRLKHSQSRLYYCVARTELWKKRIQIAERHTWLGDRFETLFQDLGTAMFRARTVNHIVWFRFKTVIHPHEATHVYMREWASRQENSREVLLYSDILTEAVLDVTPGLDRKKVKNEILKFVKSHPEARGHFVRLRRARKAILVRLFSRLGESTINLLPLCVHKTVAQNFIPIKIRAAIGSKRILTDFLPGLLSTGIEFDLSELKELEVLSLKPREELRLRADI